MSPTRNKRNQTGIELDGVLLLYGTGSGSRQMLAYVAAESHVLEKEDDPRPLHLSDAYGHFINYSHKTLQSNTTVRLKLPSKQQTVATPIQLMKGCR